LDGSPSHVLTKAEGRPVLVSDAWSALSSLGDIVLADFTGYLIGQRVDAAIVRDDSRFFDTDECAFRLILRMAGQPVNSTPVKLRNGTDTVSHFVVLEAR
jgi:HK97 family phage major capsid protein